MPWPLALISLPVRDSGHTCTNATSCTHCDCQGSLRVVPACASPSVGTPMAVPISENAKSHITSYQMLRRLSRQLSNELMSTIPAPLKLYCTLQRRVLCPKALCSLLQ